ncbi:MAG: hypothetical protein K6U80_19895 [Firmicutes bacterium]|nr:hypothetical protein [Bacillota bacterium]
MSGLTLQAQRQTRRRLAGNLLLTAAIFQLKPEFRRKERRNAFNFAPALSKSALPKRRE